MPPRPRSHSAHFSAALTASGVFALASVGAPAQEPDGFRSATWSRPVGMVAQAPLPGSRDALFGDEPDKPAPKSREQPLGDEKPAPKSREQLFGDEPAKPAATKPESRDQLFGDDIAKPKTKETALPALDFTGSWRGYVQTDFAYTYENPEHWSKARGRVELARVGRLSDALRYHVSARIDYDAVFDIERNFYPADVVHEQRRDFQWRETYLDVSAGDLQFRLGRQHIIWGEVPGLFFADVVSARDVREFVLPEFDSLRIPQWAVRAEYFASASHFELVWIPYVTVDRIGKPGGDFYPFPPPPPPGFGATFRAEREPSHSLDNTNYGLRLSTLQSGWDLAGFAYRSIDPEPTFHRAVVTAPAPTFVFTPQHERITQYGGTLSKDLGSFVLKAEAIYTSGKGFSVQRLSDADGIVRLDIFDYLIGADFSLAPDTRLYAYGFQRRFVQYDSDIVPDRVESGATLQLTHKVNDRLELQTLFISSLNRSEWMLRPKAIWNFARNWRMNVGLDVFHGPPLGFFGRFSNRDRIYTDIRYSF